MVFYHFIIWLVLARLALAFNVSKKFSITGQGSSTKQNQCVYNFNFDSTGQSANLKSPNYPSEYPPNIDCRYFISSPAGTQMILTCNDFNVETSPQCQYDIFYLSLTGSQTFSDQKYACGKGTFSHTTTSNKLSIGFRTDSGNPKNQDPYRFQCQISVVGNPAQPPPIQSCTCGNKNENTRIVGGQPTGVGEYPWRCALYTKSRGVFCGCTIISQNWILTAAHCTNAVKGESIFVNVGDYDLTTTSESDNRVKSTDRVIQNSAYDTSNQDSDTALLHLTTPLTFTRNIQPVCLPWKYRNADFSGIYVTATGWGTTLFGGQTSDVLQKVELPILSDAKCRQLYPTELTTNMICTYAEGKDTCQGDSGGSIDYRDPKSGMHYAIGITSWGVDCAAKNKPGVYVKITNFLDWIQQNTGDNFCQV